MLTHLASAFIIGVIVLNLVALALLGASATGHYAFARVTTPVAAALALFFCEHFVGLGRLVGLWPVTTIASAWVVWRRRDLLRAHWRVEAAFFAAFTWAFAWRFTSPSIVESSEKISDLAIIATYLPGGRLPATDAWFPPYPFDIYYSFQHYAAALLGRLFALSPGLTYNLAFCFLIALALTAAAAGVYRICRSVPGTALVMAAFALGGTGATIPVHFMVPKPELWSSMRFIGDVATRAESHTPFGRWLLDQARVSTLPMKLPTETFAYLISLGDYHAPLGGFYLLTLALLCLALLETDAAPRTAWAALAVLGATIPVTAIANGWTLPLQGILVVTWIAYRLASRRAPDWRALAAGVLVGTALCYPFLSSFAYRVADYGVHLRVVGVAEHTPPLFGVILLAPLLAAILVPLACRDRRPWVVWSSLLWFELLLFSELFFIDDIYAGVYSRFNTTLKWWPWIQAGALLTAGAYGLRSASRVCRRAMAVVLCLAALYGIDLGRELVTGPKPDMGRLEGNAAVTKDRIERAILEYLQVQPRGVVLQRPLRGSYTSAPSIALFAGQMAFLGWSEHENLWRGQRADVMLRDAAVKRFYAGEMPNAAEWLLQNRIDHVLWLKAEAQLPAGTFERLDEQLRSGYFWIEFYRVGEFRVGVWSRRR